MQKIITQSSSNRRLYALSDTHHLPKPLIHASIDDIFDDSKHCYGLMQIFFIWSGIQLRKTDVGKELNKEEFEDQFHNAFEKVIISRNNNKIHGKSTLELYGYLKRIFTNNVYNSYRKNRGKFILLYRSNLIDDFNTIPLVEYNVDAEHEAYYKIIDTIIEKKKLLSKTELKLWEALKNYSGNKEEIVNALGITSKYYNTIVYRLLNKLLNANIKNYI